MLYWFLLLLTAAIAYLLGSMDTMIIASNFVFHRSLRRLGKSDVWISNFNRLYGISGFVKLLLIELVRDIIPILIGGLLMGFTEHAEVGRAFAGFCLVLGRLYPIYYDFHGGHASICLIVAAFGVDTSVGIACLLMLLAATWFSKMFSLGAVVGALIAILVSVMALDDSLIMRLSIFTAALVLLKHIPAIVRMVRGREEKFSVKEDITYKLDDQF